MKLQLLFFLISGIVFGQIQTDRSVAETVELIQLKTISNQDITGHIYKGDGLGGNSIELNPNGSLIENTSDCMSKTETDNGFWSIRNQNLLILNFKKNEFTFNIFQYGDFNFYVPIDENSAFLNDFAENQKLLKNFKPVSVNGKIFSKEDAIAHQLQKKYFGRELEIDKISISKN